MSLEIRTRKVPVDAQLRVDIRRFRDLALGRLAARVKRTVVRLRRGRNAATGEAGVVCELELHLAGEAPVATRLLKPSSDQAVANAFVRARRILLRRLRRAASGTAGLLAPVARAPVPAGG